MVALGIDHCFSKTTLPLSPNRKIKITEDGKKKENEEGAVPKEGKHQKLIQKGG